MNAMKMIDVLYGTALHRYQLKITRENPNGTASVELENVISQFDIRTLKGQEYFGGLIKQIKESEQEGLHENCMVRVEIELEQFNVIVMN